MPDRSSLTVLALIVALTASTLTLGAGVAAADSQVAIQSATVDSETPRVGEDVTVRTTIRNFESATTAARINQVSLRQGTRTLTTSKDPGTIGTGGSIELPLTTTFDSPGRKQLTVHVYGVSADGNVFNLEYPVSMTVNDHGGDVQLSLETPTDPSTESRVNVTVANGAATNVSNLRLTLSGPNATVEDASRVNASLLGGRERVVGYDVTFDGAGRHPLTATLGYRDPNGNRDTVTETRTFVVDPARVDAELDAEVVRENDTARIDTSLTNFGNVPLEGVRLRAESDGETVARKLVGDVGIESTRDVSIGESSLPAGEVTLHAVYEAAGDTHETATVVDFAPTTDGRITLTGIEVLPAGGSIRLAGSASNTGETTVTGAVVSVVGTDRVTPVSPAKDYFVGNVPAGEFTSFELTARLAGNRTDAVPVRISYIADGREYSRVVEVDLADAGGGAPAGPQAGRGEPDGPPGGGGFLGVGRIDVVGLLLRLAAVLAVGAGVIYWWRRRGDDEQ
ncbi:hypothetical protein EI982_10920 [Haloplanus rallus]|jgi:hypothetical protein|uniref:CARDB domain-containing protein n=1 Tax=Haloplanus rallus TaxID=1816183 RepID=A0A6B9FF44_9EURY|nr:hypothetical protein [Haloplanus rallus]QGX95269.1 hypothetical protein EI982_10920 [Haloplanus rallus]